MTAAARRVPAARRAARPTLPLLVAALLAFAALLAGAGAASAHSALERSDPPNGGMVATGRTSLTLWFGEPVSATGSTFTVRPSDASAPPVPTTATLDASGDVVHLRTAPLERGTYTIAWSVVATDGHPTRGTVVFGAGFRPDGVPAGGSGAAPDAGQVLARLGDLGGTLLALGALTVAGRVLSALGATGARLRRRVLRLGAIGAGMSLVAAAAVPVLTAQAGLDAPASSGPGARLWAAVGEVLLSSTWGVLWLLRLLALAVGLVGLVVATRRSGDGGSEAGSLAPQGWTRPARLALGALVVAASLDGFAGHASTLPARSVPAAVAATLHVLAAGVWAGGLLVLVVTVVPLMRLDAATRRSVSPRAWRAFSPVAAASTVVLVGTGLYEAGRHVGSLATATSSVYGTGVLAKLLLVAVALVLAGYNTVLVNPAVSARVGDVLRLGPGWRPRRHRLATTVTVEACVLAGAVAVAALMTSVPTAREVQAASAVTAPHSATVDGLFVTFEAVPTGEQLRLVVRTEAVVRPLPTPPSGVEVGLAPAGSITLRAVEPGRWEASAPVPESADWTAAVVVHRSGRPDSVVLVPGSTATAGAATPLELVTSGLAVAMLLGLATVVAVRRRHRATDSPSHWSPPAGVGGAEPGPGTGDEHLEKAMTP
ncbi:copper resistance CopC family protein [Intrasporangium flavum]|uniref:copper resistance CopC/CopD family protein n=1 Tax=Intrasporangium flavum TaxID=1428657 RepID=UPI00096BF0BB|nr:copper resistance CopC family protein [Intrasporangium flavum]